MLQGDSYHLAIAMTPFYLFIIRFKDVYEDKLGDYYSFNPCYSYNEGLCSDVYVCYLAS